jgi:hypothetical protein
MHPASKHGNNIIRISAVVLGMVFAVSAAPQESNRKRFHDTDNSVTRIQILHEVGTPMDSKVKAGSSAAADAQLTTEDKALLLEALQDTRPTIVEASVRRIGELKVVEFEQQLITLFSDAEKRFSGGYAERLKLTIISAAGKCNGPLTVPFLENLLRIDSGSQYFETILLAAQETGNPALLSGVKEFRNRLETELQRRIEADANPMSTSELKVAIKLAQDVESGLLNGNGGR